MWSLEAVLLTQHHAVFTEWQDFGLQAQEEFACRVLDGFIVKRQGLADPNWHLTRLTLQNIQSSLPRGSRKAICGKSFFEDSTCRPQAATKLEDPDKCRHCVYEHKIAKAKRLDAGCESSVKATAGKLKVQLLHHRCAALPS